MKFTLNETVHVEHSNGQLEIHREYLEEIYVLPHGDYTIEHPCRGITWTLLELERDEIPSILWAWMKCNYCDLRFKVCYRFVDCKQIEDTINARR
jgi:hypothetical protein